ncbi:MAG: metallophosphoesterase [Anaerolineae bacterium]
MSHFGRVVDLEDGVAMVVTDLHGDWGAYRRYRDHFLTLQDHGQADTLILCGDLIHFTGPAAQDKSLEMVLDVLALREELGDRLIYLLGNHEIPHLYGMTLRKGDTLFTPRFEWAMGEHRSRILALFDSLPFFVRTPAGVTVCHAGATDAFGWPDGPARLFQYSHKKVWQETAASLPSEMRPRLRRLLSRQYGRSYDDIVREYLAVPSRDDPRYDDFLIGTAVAAHPDFELLWSALFTRNEYQFGRSGYRAVVRTMLQALSREYHPQSVLVSGHIDCEHGFHLVNSRHLRIASAKNAHPRESGCFLLLDCRKPVKQAGELLGKLGTVFKAGSHPAAISQSRPESH